MIGPIEYTDKDLWVLARTIWGEARGEPMEGKIAVGWVAVNRALAKYRGTTITTVCQAPEQFSCWNINDPNRDNIRNMDSGDPSLAPCYAAAKMVLDGMRRDPTFGSRHYKVSKLPWPKSWGEQKDPCVVIGKHSFYNNVA